MIFLIRINDFSKTIMEISAKLDVKFCDGQIAHNNPYYENIQTVKKNNVCLTDFEQT